METKIETGNVIPICRRQPGPTNMPRETNFTNESKLRALNCYYICLNEAEKQLSLVVEAKERIRQSAINYCNDNLKKKMDRCWESRSVSIYHHLLPEWDDEAAIALTDDDVLWSYFNLTDSNPKLVSKKLTHVVNKVKLPRGRDVKRGRPK